MNAPTPLEEFVRAATAPKQTTIGLPKTLGTAERRFPLTPEGAEILVERGFRVKMERGAAATIHFSDEAYSRRGIEIVDRAQALDSDIVVHLPAICEPDALLLRRGAMLLGFAHPEAQTARAVRILLHKMVTYIALDRIADDNSNEPFADILREIDGRAAIAIASSLLADAAHGKGILLGGVAGVVPCEVTIIGADLAAHAAAQSALGLGATVRVFDNDVYRLRTIASALGPGVITSTLHPKVLTAALRSADIVIAASMHNPVEIAPSIIDSMKRGVLTFDLNYSSFPMFPTLPPVDLALATPAHSTVAPQHRVCYINAGSAVPRTAAMALSNTLLAQFSSIVACESAVNALKILPGLRKAACTFMGKPVAPNIARLLGLRHIDINILLQFS